MPIGLTWDNDKGVAVLSRTAAGAIGEDDTLETVVLLSLFTNAPATAAELEQAGRTEQLGWWADADSIRGARAPYGSKLWLLERGKTTLATLVRAEQYCLEALAWLVEANIAASVQVLATRPAQGIIALEVTLKRPMKLLPPFRRLWNVRNNAVL